MHTMTSTEFARNPRAVYDRVLETQEAVEITRHGKPVVRVAPVEQKRGLTGAEIVAKIAQRQKQLGVPPPDPDWQRDYDTWINPIENLPGDPWER